MTSFLKDSHANMRRRETKIPPSASLSQTSDPLYPPCFLVVRQGRSRTRATVAGRAPPVRMHRCGLLAES